MYVETQDEEVFKRFWLDERDNLPRWLSDGMSSRACSEEDYLDFCLNRCERVYYLDNVALFFVEKRGDNANIHFSILRGMSIEPLMGDLAQIRDTLLKDYRIIVGWAYAKNRKLQKVLIDLGYRYGGLDLWDGESHGQIMIWKCFCVSKPLES